MSITASVIKELREATGAGMMDCKKALQENGGDFEAAKDWLREKGIAKAGKKAGRVAAEGLVAVISTGTTGTVIEVNSETDFVSKNEQFQSLVTDISTKAQELKGDTEALKAATEAQVTSAVGTIGEKIEVRRAAQLSVENGVVSTYLHNAVNATQGKIAVLVALESTAAADKLEALGKQIAMHVAAAKPVGMSRDDVPAAEIDRERKIFSEQAKASGKPDNIVEKMVEGRIRKFYEEVVLPEQVFVIDGKSKVQDVVDAAAKEAGTDITLTGFVQFTLGEGIEKKEEDFAEEVAKVAAG